MKLETHGKIAIFGGTFDPVHNGHVEFVRQAFLLGGFKKIYLIPNKTPPHKVERPLPAEARVEMLRLAFGNIPNVEISRVELDREGPSYAIDTIEHFRKTLKADELFTLLGADAFADLQKWYRFEDVIRESNFLVLSRKGFKLPKNAAPQAKVVFLEAPLPEVSSSDVRTRLSKGESAKGLLPEPVWEYLKQNQFYATNGV